MNQPESPLDALILQFKKCYGESPRWIVTAPGRVNLIGEHTDYNLLPVLPMPISRAVRIAVSPRSDHLVRFQNVDPQFKPFDINIETNLERSANQWENYVLAAIRSVVAGVSDSGGHTLRGFNALVESDLPPAAGLSSSSALVIASCLSLLTANGVQWSLGEVAERMRLAEQFVGTAGGGMDQAVIALGQPESALLVQFDPLKAEPIRVPDEVTVFVINSGYKAEKSGAARYSYNRRALECVVGVQLLKHAVLRIDSSGSAKPLQQPAAAWESLRDVYRDCKTSKIPWQTLLLHVPVDGVSLEQAADTIGLNGLETLCLQKKLDLATAPDWLPGGLLHVFPRVAHVLAEADRVYSVIEAFQAQDCSAVFNISRAGHASCRDLYHISTPEIEQLVFLAESAGARSVRITGAGFGGCVVALVLTADAAAFGEKLAAMGVDAGNVIEARSAGGARVTNL